MISDKLKQTILKQLDLADFEIKDETVATEVPGWDSLSHVKILTAIEDALGIRFRSLEVLRLRNIGELQALVDRKLAGSQPTR
jgi:acyl carrier protein